MEWADDVANRPRRANAGNRLQELLRTGLDEEDERDLQGLDASSSDTSFTLGSDEEAIDEVDSDFDAEEVAGVLEGETVETEATVRRAERQERQRERNKKLQRTQHFTKPVAARNRAKQGKQRQRQRQQQQPHVSKRPRRDDPDASSASDEARSDDEADEDDGDDVMDLRQRVRRRPPPTIPCVQRLVDAHERAASRRAAQAAQALEDGGEGAAAEAAVMNTHQGLNVGKARPRARRPQQPGVRRAGGGTRKADGALSGLYSAAAIPSVASPRIALYEMPAQSIAYSSGQSLLERYNVSTIVSFAEDLPLVFRH